MLVKFFDQVSRSNKREFERKKWYIIIQWKHLLLLYLNVTSPAIHNVTCDNS